MAASSQKGRRGTTVKTPAVLKLVEGRSAGRDSGGRAIKPAPSFRRLPPEPPDWLDGEALAEWHRIVPELARLELVKPIDAAALTAYCLAWQRLRAAQSQIDEHGLTAHTSQGIGVAPWVRIADSASRDLRAWAHEFGLTPAAESNVASGGGDGEEDANPFGAAAR